MRFEQLKIFTGNANPSLAAKICAALGCPLGSAEVEPFSDGEIRLQILENVRGADVFAVQPTCTPVDRHLMELLLSITLFAGVGAAFVLVNRAGMGHAGLALSTSMVALFGR